MTGEQPHRTTRPVGWSMDLLTQLFEHPIDPDYTAPAPGRPPRRSRAALAVAALVIGVLVALQVSRTVEAAPEAETERQEIIARLQEAEARNEQLRAEQERTEREVNELQSRSGDQATQQRIGSLAPVAGQQAVTGPGIVVTVDDAEGSPSGGRVTDADLRQLVNGLWQGGAEAVAVNGHRLSSRTAIRGAGSAITVDYTSLLRPYVVEAIGDPRTLEARYADTSGGAWWADARRSYGLRYEVATSADLRLGADPGLTVGRATPGGR